MVDREKIAERLEFLARNQGDFSTAAARLDLLEALRPPDLDANLLTLLLHCLSTNSRNSQWTFDETIVTLIEETPASEWLPVVFSSIPYFVNQKELDWALNHVFYFIERAGQRDRRLPLATFLLLSSRIQTQLIDSLGNSFFEFYKRNLGGLQNCSELIRHLRERRATS